MALAAGDAAEGASKVSEIHRQNAAASRVDHGGFPRPPAAGEVAFEERMAAERVPAFVADPMPRSEEQGRRPREVRALEVRCRIVDARRPQVSGVAVSIVQARALLASSEDGIFRHRCGFL